MPADKKFMDFSFSPFLACTLFSNSVYLLYFSVFSFSVFLLLSLFPFWFFFLAVSWTHIWLSKNQRISCVKIMFGICNEPTYKFSSGRSWIFTEITSRGLFFSFSGSSFFRWFLRCVKSFYLHLGIALIASQQIL